MQGSITGYLFKAFFYLKISDKSIDGTVSYPLKSGNNWWSPIVDGQFRCTVRNAEVGIYSIEYFFLYLQLMSAI